MNIQKNQNNECPHLLIVHGPYLQGYCAVMQGYANAYPSNIRSKQDKTLWSQGYCEGKQVRDAMLTGMTKTLRFGRTLVPVIAGYAPDTFRAVWRDEGRGLDYDDLATVSPSVIQGEKTQERMYHLIAINERTGNKTYCTRYPMNHKDSCVMLSKFSHHPARRLQLEQV